MSIDDPSGPLAYEIGALLRDHERQEAAFRDGHAVGPAWQLLDAALQPGGTETRQGAGGASRLAWGAEESAEFHQGLVEEAGRGERVERGAWSVGGRNAAWGHAAYKR